MDMLDDDPFGGFFDAPPAATATAPSSPDPADPFRGFFSTPPEVIQQADAKRLEQSRADPFDHPDLAPEERLGRILNAHADVRSPWENVSAAIKSRFPQADVKGLRQEYELDAARKWLAKNYKETTGDYIRERMLPDLGIGRTIDTLEYKRARERFEKGRADEKDAAKIALYEHKQKLEHEKGIGETALDTAAGLPALGAEILSGQRLLRFLGIGARAAAGVPAALEGNLAQRVLQAAPAFARRTAENTAVMPRFWLPGAAENAAKNGGSAADPKNLLPAAALGYLQMAVLGSLPKIGSEMGFVPRTAARVGTGMVEQQAIDAIAGSTGLQEHYGVAGELAAGRPREAGKMAASQATMFGAFAVFGGREGTDKALKRVEDAGRKKVGAGYRADSEAVQKAMADEAEAVMKEVQPKPLPDRAKQAARQTNYRANVMEPEIVGPKQEAPVEGVKPPEWPVQKVGPDEPPIPEGHVRMYHGGVDQPGARWVSPDRQYATDYRRSPSNEVWYIDLPADSKYLSKSFNDEGVSNKAPPGNVELPPDVARQMKQVSPGATEPSSASSAVKTSDLTPAPTVEALSPVELAVLEGRTVNPETGKVAKSLRKLADELGVSHEQVRLIEKAAIAKQGELESRARQADALAEGERLARRGTEEPERNAEGLRPPLREALPKDAFGREGREAPKTPDEQFSDAFMAAFEKGDEAAVQKMLADHYGEEHVKQVQANAAAQRAVKDKLKRAGFSSEAVAGTVRSADADARNAANAAKEEAVQPGAPAGPDAAGPGRGSVNLGSIAEKAVRDWGAHAVDVVEPLKKLVKDAQSAEQQMRMDANQIGNKELKAKNRLTLKQYLEKYGVGSKAEAEKIYQARLAELNKAQAQLDAANKRLDELAAAKEKAHADWRADAGPGGRGVERQREVAAALSEAERVEQADLESIKIPDQPGKPGMGAARANLEEGPPDAGLGGRVREALTNRKEALVESYTNLKDNLKELAGQQYPRTHKLSQESGNAMVAHASGHIWAERAAPVVIDKVMNEITDYSVPREQLTRSDQQAIGRKFMAALHEMRFRHTIDAFERKAAELMDAARFEEDKGKRDALIREASTYQTAAGKVKTTIGRENAELSSEKAYQDTLRNKGFQEFLDRWRKNVVPMLESFYRRAGGVDEDTAIEKMTQLPGLTFNAMPIREGKATSAPSAKTYSRSGDLRNVKQYKLPFDRMFTGAADGYVIDPAEVIVNSIVKSIGAATKAEMNRVLVRNGQAQWGKPGEKVEFNGEPAEVIRAVDPPRGTQEAANGETTLYVDRRIADEYRKAIDLKDKWNKLPGSKVATLAAIMSSVELEYHSKNLLTGLFQPGMPLLKFPGILRDVVRESPEVMERVAELAAMGAIKPKGYDTGVLWGGKTDPTVWTAKFLDVLDLTMRLTADKAFDRLGKRYGKGLELTESNRRDFINQLGQYNIRAQQNYVRWLRQTGIGPFATAGTNFTVQGLRSLIGSSGLRTTNWKTDMALRAEKLGRIMMVAAVPAVMNYALWGNVFGDDKTPIGAIKLGSNGNKTNWLDLVQFTGFTRGARTMGLSALAEGLRAGAPATSILDKGARDAFVSATHPAIGPPMQFMERAALRESGGYETAPEKGSKMAKANFLAPHSQTLINLQSAFLNLNPLVGTISGYDRVFDKDNTWLDKLFKAMGPFGVKESTRPRGQPDPETITIRKK